MSNFKIIGTPNPEIGKEVIYKIGTSNLPVGVLPGQTNPFGSNPFMEEVKWSIYILESGKWILKEKNNKTGPTANYTFTEISLKRRGIRIVAHLGEEKATLDIKPHDTIERKIVKVELCDALGNLQAKPFGYNQTVLAKVHCLNLDNCTVHVTLWEDDAPGKGHSEINKNNKAITKTEKVSNGIAEVKFRLAPDFAKIADAKLATGDKSEGKTHEYYVTAEVFRQETKSSNNINVINPNDKKTADTKAVPTPVSKKPVSQQKPAPKSNAPAAKKGPSKKEEKKVNETSSGSLFDWGESMLKAVPDILPSPSEVLNNVLKLFTPDKKEEKNGVCQNCINPVTAKQLEELFPKAEQDTLKKVAATYTKYMEELGMNTCWNKAHFFAQAMVESGSKLVLHEGESMNYLADDLYLGRWDPKEQKRKIILSYFKTHRDDAYKYGRIEEIKNHKKVVTQKANSEMIANLAYGPNSNKGKELGNTQSTDGWNFRGKGLIQLTGRSAYEFANNYTKKEGADIISNSDLVSKNVSIAVLSSMAFWKWKNIAPLANGSKNTKKICKKVGNNVTLANGKTNHDEKQSAFTDNSSVTFKVDDCKYGKVQNTPISGKAPWMPFALKEIGQKAILGNANNSRITEYFNASTNGKGLNEGTNWCGAFASWCFTQAGYTPPPLSCRAAMWQFWKKDKPIYGSAAVIDWESNELAKENGKDGAVGGAGHITFVVGISADGNHYYCVGGNQGGVKGARTVKISKYSKNDIDWFVIPPNYSPSKEEYKLNIMNSEADVDSASTTRT
jgi:uncharacterized protein (TIGR02594 family)